MISADDCSRCSARTHGLFNCLNADQMTRLMGDRVSHAYEPGQALFYEGTPALAVYCIREGQFKLWRAGGHGDPHVVGLRGRGDLLGYRAVFAGRHYCSTAEPLERSVVCTIPRDTFLSIARDSAEFSFRLMTRLAVISLETEDYLVARALDKAGKRIARYLSRLVPSEMRASAEPLPLPLPRTRQAMAELVGTTPETLSRTLHALASRGIIELDRHGIRVCDLAALRRVAR